MQDSCQDNSSGRFQWSLTKVPIQLSIMTIEDFQSHVKTIEAAVVPHQRDYYQVSFWLVSTTCLGYSILF